jgi:hypothetical protein
MYFSRMIDVELIGKFIAAICASSALVLKALEVDVGKNVTCYPAFKDKLDGKFTFVDKIVIQDGTYQGPATDIAFALKIAEIIAHDHEQEEAEISKADKRNCCLLCTRCMISEELYKNVGNFQVV